LLLRREERLKNVLEPLGTDACTTIENRRTDDAAIGLESDDDFYPPIARRILAHRFAGIHDEIQWYLMEFHTVARYRRNGLIDARDRALAAHHQRLFRRP
jgi:hypothetical protein